MEDGSPLNGSPLKDRYMQASERDEKIWKFCQMIGALDRRWSTMPFIEGEPIYQETFLDTKKLLKKMVKWLDSQDVTQYPKKPV